MNAVTNYCAGYYNHINKTELAVVTAATFIYGFSLSILHTALHSSLSLLAVNLKPRIIPSIQIGLFWATATFIHGIAGPLFRRYHLPVAPGNPPHNLISYKAEIIRSGLALAATVCVATAIGYANKGVIVSYIAHYILASIFSYKTDTTLPRFIIPRL